MLARAAGAHHFLTPILRFLAAMADPFKVFDELLAEVEEGRPRRQRAPVVRWLLWLLFVGLAAALPFGVLLRTSTALYGAGWLGAWPALAAGAALTFGLLAAYVLLAARRLRGRVNVPRRLLQGLAILVCAWCVYGLVFLSGANAKTEAVRAEYRSLHPLLRMAVGTLVLVDGDLLVTDAARTPEDYAVMGLPANEASLHLEQVDGYAHALDLRTVGRSGVRNTLTRVYFAAMGFRTLRHVGTADHLHISLGLPPASGS